MNTVRKRTPNRERADRSGMLEVGAAGDSGMGGEIYMARGRPGR
jgi:hypothetical protein